MSPKDWGHWDAVLVGTAVVLIGSLVFVAVMAYLGRPRDPR